MKQLYPNDVDDANADREKLPEEPGDSAEWEDGEAEEEMLKPRRLASPAEPSKEEQAEREQQDVGKVSDCLNWSRKE